MGVLYVLLFVIFVVISILLIIAILLQSGRGGGLAGALGGISGAESALGVRAASQIEKATGVLVIIFFLTAICLAYIAIHRTKVILPVKKVGTRAEQAAAATEPAKAGEATAPAGTTKEATQPAGALEKAAEPAASGRADDEQTAPPAPPEAKE